MEEFSPLKLFMGRLVYEVCRISQMSEAKTTKRKEPNKLVTFLCITAILSNSR